MHEMKALLEHFWITREYDKELYYKVKRELPSLRHFLNEQLGWRLYSNDKLIKLEKIPVKGGFLHPGHRQMNAPPISKKTQGTGGQ